MAWNLGMIAFGILVLGLVSYFAFIKKPGPVSNPWYKDLLSIKRESMRLIKRMNDLGVTIDDVCKALGCQSITVAQIIQKQKLEIPITENEMELLHRAHQYLDSIEDKRPQE